MATRTLHTRFRRSRAAASALSIGAVLFLSACADSEGVGGVATLQPGTTIEQGVPNQGDELEMPEADLATIEGLVSTVKGDKIFPLRVDELTVVVDITAEENTVHYFYRYNNMDPSVYSEESLKGDLLFGFCTSDETEPFLERNIRVLVSFEFEGTGVTYDVEFESVDCD